MVEEITVSPDDVRRALGERGNLEDYPDLDLAYPIDQAEAIVNDELLPHSGGTSRLELVGAEIAAAYVAGDGAVESVSQGGRKISFNTADAMSHWRKAKQLDPTGRLGALEMPNATFRVI